MPILNYENFSYELVPVQFYIFQCVAFCLEANTSCRQNTKEHYYDAFKNKDHAYASFIKVPIGAGGRFDSKVAVVEGNKHVIFIIASESSCRMGKKD
jgi:hypothetical protein